VTSKTGTNFRLRCVVALLEREVNAHRAMTIWPSLRAPRHVAGCREVLDFGPGSRERIELAGLFEKRERNAFTSLGRSASASMRAVNQSGKAMSTGNLRCNRVRRQNIWRRSRPRLAESGPLSGSWF